MESSFDLLDNNKSSSDKSSSDEKKGVIRDNKKEEDIYDSLEDNEAEVQLKIKGHTFESK